MLRLCSACSGLTSVIRSCSALQGFAVLSVLWSSCSFQFFFAFTAGQVNAHTCHHPPSWSSAFGRRAYKQALHGLTYTQCRTLQQHT